MAGSGVPNDYNKTQATSSVVRVGNWVEENALLDATGRTRYKNLMADDSHKRIVQHNQTGDGDWHSTMESSFRYRYAQGAEAVNERQTHTLPRRSATKAERIEQQARDQLEAQKAEAAKRDAAAEIKEKYGNKMTSNRQRIIETGKPIEHPLDGPAVTIYSRRLDDAAIDGDPTDRAQLSLTNKYVEGTTAATGANPHGKSTAFSKPISEFEGQCR